VRATQKGAFEYTSYYAPAVYLLDQQAQKNAVMAKTNKIGA